MANVGKDDLATQADTRSVSLSSLERLYVKRAIDQLVSSLNRSMKAEIPGSDVIRIREGEVTMLNGVKGRL